MEDQQPPAVQNSTSSDQHPNSASPSHFSIVPPSTAGASQDGLPAHQPQADRDVTMGRTTNRDSIPAADANHVPPATIPQPRAGGAPARIYLNEKVVPYLLEGMKPLAKDQPPNPLRLLGEYLIAKSAEIGEPANEQPPATS